MVLRLKPKGLLVGGPPCGSWVWINRATSQRTKSRIFGNTSRGYVRDANTKLGFSLLQVLHCYLMGSMSTSYGVHWPTLLEMSTNHENDNICVFTLNCIQGSQHDLWFWLWLPFLVVVRSWWNNLLDPSCSPSPTCNSWRWWFFRFSGCKYACALLSCRVILHVLP